MVHYGYVALQISSWFIEISLLYQTMFLLHYDTHKGLYRIELSSRVMLDCKVPQWDYCIEMFIYINLCQIIVFLND